MNATTTRAGTAWRPSLAVLAAAALLLSGCTAGSSTDAAPTSAEEPVITPAPTSSEEPDITPAQDAYWDAVGENGENLSDIDGVAEDFPAEIPLPQGDLVLSMAGDGIWDMIFETQDSEAQAEQLVQAVGRIVAPEDEFDVPDGQGGTMWTFLDETYAVLVQMQPGPFPPPMVAISVLER